MLPAERAGSVFVSVSGKTLVGDALACYPATPYTVDEYP